MKVIDLTHFSNFTLPKPTGCWSQARWVWAGILLLSLIGPVCSQTLDGFDPAPQGTVYALAVQPDGQVVAGGSFTSLAGQSCNRIGRLKADGTFDASFNPGANNGVYALAVQTDGRILVGGAFSTLGGQAHGCLGRLNADGSVDASFNPVVSNTVVCLALQADGKIIVGGGWIGINQTTRRYLARLNTDGTLDPAFNPTSDSAVYSVAVQPDGRLVAGGTFTTLSGQPANRIGRLNSNGSYDSSFSSDANSFVFCLGLQPDGKILVGGHFTSLAWTTCNHAGRLNPNGSLDSTFGSGADGDVVSLALQADGKILLGGAFTNLSGVTFSRFGRLDASGSADSTFSAPINAGASGSLSALAVQSDGKILVGGSFTNVAGQTRTNLARLQNTGPAPQTLSLTGGALTWSRSGTGPEFWRTTFDASTNGADWISLGAGAKVAGGWQVSGLALPLTASLRARGFVTGGRYSSSSSYVEIQTGPPVIAAQPVSQTNNAGATVCFQVSASGVPPLGYQWRKGGTPLSDGPNTAGCRLQTLALSNVFGGVRGGYSVVVTNPFGAVTSSVATLTVMDPFIVTPPPAQWVNAGDNVTLSVTGGGTAPLSYQWRKDGVNLAGATNSVLALAGVQRNNIGGYDAIVTNAYGSATSSVASLSINLATCDAFQVGPIYPIAALALQTDGRILYGTTVSDFIQSLNVFGRLNPDGSADTNYNVQVNGVQFQTYVQALALQPDGNLLVGGSYVWIGPQSRNGLARVSPSGVVSPDFYPGPSGMYPFVSCFGLQPDQKIALAGCFESLGWSAQTNVGRIDSAGVLDAGFRASTELALYPNQGRIYALALQTDGKIVLGGIFSTLCGQPRSRIGRLNADGSLDAAFNPAADAYVGCLAIQPDGGILVGGSFTNLGGQPRAHLARLSADGSLDPSFNPGADSSVSTLALQADGKIIIGGTFTNLSRQPCNRLGRLNNDGSPDPSFNPGVDASVTALALQADGKLLVGGSFGSLAGQPRARLGRLNNTEPATQSLARQGSHVTWLRGGTSPEVWRTTFEVSTNGTNWTSLGPGTRIPGGWAVDGVLAATNAFIRARGFLTGGQCNASTWFVEANLPEAGPQSPVILVNGQLGFRSGAFGFNTWGLAGQSFVIETSSNLVQWTGLATNTFGFLPIYFSDPTLPRPPRSFYRARAL